MDKDVEFLPATIVYGCAKPEMRFRLHEGRQVFFCLNNGNLHLTERNLRGGSYGAGSFLGALCREHCRKQRNTLAPCPAFARSHKIGTENTGLATVEMYAVPQWQKCGGVGKLLEVEMTEEERFFFLGYLDDHWTDEFQWRDGLVNQWNAYWSGVPNGWGDSSRAAKFDRMIWSTIRCPALIPQVWLNWLHAAPDHLIKTLEDGRASRVDFVAFSCGTRHVIEIDGLSHYAIWHEDTRSYSPDEREYARNLKIERWLRSEGWSVTRIGRYEVREAMKADDPFDVYTLMAVLPFGRVEDYPPQWSAAQLGLPEIHRVVRVPAAVDDDIPF